MGIFGFGKKKEEKACDCGGNCAPTPVVEEVCDCGGNCGAAASGESKDSSAGDASVKVLGSGCSKCNQLEAATKEALSNLGMDTTIEHVTDFADIAAYGVMTTPALVVDGKVVSMGKVLKTAEVENILKKARG